MSNIPIFDTSISKLSIRYHYKVVRTQYDNSPFSRQSVWRMPAVIVRNRPCFFNDFQFSTPERVRGSVHSPGLTPYVLFFMPAYNTTRGFWSALFAPAPSAAHIFPCLTRPLTSLRNISQHQPASEGCQYACTAVRCSYVPGIPHRDMYLIRYFSSVHCSLYARCGRNPKPWNETHLFLFFCFENLGRMERRVSLSKHDHLWMKPKSEPGEPVVNLFLDTRYSFYIYWCAAAVSLLLCMAYIYPGMKYQVWTA